MVLQLMASNCLCFSILPWHCQILLNSTCSLFSVHKPVIAEALSDLVEQYLFTVHKQVIAEALSDLAEQYLFTVHKPVITEALSDLAEKYLFTVQCS